MIPGGQCRTALASPGLEEDDLDRRHHAVGYGVDEDLWSTLGLYRGDDRADHRPHPIPIDHHGRWRHSYLP